MLAGVLPLLLEAAIRAPEGAVSAFDSSFKEKDMLMWLAHKDYQRFVGESGWDGGVSDGVTDYLAVVSTDVGNPTGEGVTERIRKETRMGETGELTSTVVIEFKSKGGERGHNGVSRYTRVYVPEGAELLEA